MRGFLAREVRSSAAGAGAGPETGAGVGAGAARATTGVAAPGNSSTSAIAGGSPATVIPAAAAKLARLIAAVNQNDAAPRRGEAGANAFSTMEKPLFAADKPESSGERLSMLADIHELHRGQFARGSRAAVETPSLGAASFPAVNPKNSLIATGCRPLLELPRPWLLDRVRLRLVAPQFDFRVVYRAAEGESGRPDATMTNL